MSVATNTLTFPDLNKSRAFCLADCDLSPCRESLFIPDLVSCSASFPALCLVLVNTMTRSNVASCRSFTRQLLFFSRSMNITFCSTVLTGVAVGATDTSLGLCRILLAKRITPGGIVAENKSVCLSVGSKAVIF